MVHSCEEARSSCFCCCCKLETICTVHTRKLPETISSGGTPDCSPCQHITHPLSCPFVFSFPHIYLRKTRTHAHPNVRKNMSAQPSITVQNSQSRSFYLFKYAALKELFLVYSAHTTDQRIQSWCFCPWPEHRPGVS